MKPRILMDPLKNIIELLATLESRKLLKPLKRLENFYGDND
ncbi:MAG: hypothetical protein N3F10_02505 [Candidatus Bathyarchaeota archaeon]|nr:hypothetical protein [Candidatus Bathyarchaeota archaeon]